MPNTPCACCATAVTAPPDIARRQTVVARMQAAELRCHLDIWSCRVRQVTGGHADAAVVGVLRHRYVSVVSERFGRVGGQQLELFVQHLASFVRGDGAQVLKRGLQPSRDLRRAGPARRVSSNARCT